MTPFMLMIIYIFFSVIYRITDLEHLKRRLYLSTVHKELSATHLHAKIPLVGLKCSVVSIFYILDMFYSQSSFRYVLLCLFYISWAALREPYNYSIVLFLLSQWSTLCIDLISFTSELFKGFLTLDGITLFATCKVRRIFTMKTVPTELSGDGNALNKTGRLIKQMFNP